MSAAGETPTGLTGGTPVPRPCLCELLDRLAGLKRELVETAKLRRKAGDESAELAFFSAAERLIELVMGWRHGAASDLFESPGHRYFVTAVSARSGQVAIAREVTCQSFEEALTTVYRLANELKLGPVLVTGINEQPQA